ncbi:diguanylate cyclase [Azotosporobacter soli]|uniref:HD-GYP domain-containing protein n=1 Tax=Azotosporobacter soli TaxID=3055040 RepID=UPI0031FEF2F3
MLRLKKYQGKNHWWAYMYGVGLLAIAIGWVSISSTMAEKTIALAMVFLVGMAGALRNLALERNRFYRASITDPLTGLHTFTHTIMLGQELLAQGNDSMLVLVNLDNFKNVNATYGHFIGNRILVQFAQRLRELWGAKAIIGRLGGDEFIAILPDLGKQRAAVTQQIEELKGQRYTADPDISPVQVEFSYGLAQADPERQGNVEELVDFADKEMYAYKLSRKTKQTTCQFNAEMPEDYRDILTVLSQKDMYTFLHSLYVAQYGVLLARKIGLDEEMVENIRLAGWLHDIGKIAVPNEILRKPGKLSQVEYQSIQKHVNYGLNLLHTFSMPTAVYNAIGQHHERYDGKGYPNQLKGDDISLSGRILAIVDAYSAMTIKRVYRRYQFSTDDALAELMRGSETQFDAALVNQFAQVLRDESREIEERQIS